MMPLPFSSRSAEVTGRDPSRFLGLHRENGGEGRACLRVFNPWAVAVLVEWAAGRQDALVRVDDSGCFEWQGVLPDGLADADYVLLVDEGEGFLRQRDPYAFAAQASGEDMFLFAEGRHGLCYQWLGARPEIRQDEEGRHWVHGVCFRLWLPGAECVAVVGPFNRWDHRMHRMMPLLQGGQDGQGTQSGIWEVFIPQLPAGTLYAFECLLPGQPAMIRVEDPCARHRVAGEGFLARVAALAEHVWRDGAWLGRRSMNRRSPFVPRLVSQTLADDFSRVTGDAGALQRLANQMAAQVHAAGGTHLLLSPRARHFSPGLHWGGPQDWRCLVDACHQAGVGVVIDWLEHEDVARFRLGCPQERSLWLSGARYWLDEFHVDGLRINGLESFMEASAEHAGQFFQDLNLLIHREFPGVLRVAVSHWPASRVTTPVHEGGLGFSLQEKPAGDK